MHQFRACLSRLDGLPEVSPANARIAPTAIGGLAKKNGGQICPPLSEQPGAAITGGSC